jgi:hypothetical protein
MNQSMRDPQTSAYYLMKFSGRHITEVSADTRMPRLLQTRKAESGVLPADDKHFYAYAQIGENVKAEKSVRN